MLSKQLHLPFHPFKEQSHGLPAQAVLPKAKDRSRRAVMHDLPITPVAQVAGLI